jgi:transketolase
MYSIGESVALRTAFGPAVFSLAKTNDRIMVVTADLGGSVNITDFKNTFPDRYINCGVAEASMIGISAGLASEGLLPFAVTFGSFLGRAIDHLRQSVLHNKLKVNVVGSHGGISNGMDGPSAHALEDIGIMRSMPGISIVAPSCPNQLPQVLAAACEQEGPVYIRLYREALPVFAEASEPFQFGKVIKRRSGSDVTLLAYGPHVGFCLEWADQLAPAASIEVIEVHTLRPLDAEGILDSVRRTGRVVTVEDHFEVGGLASATAEVLARTGTAARLRPVAVTGYARSGPYEELRDAVGLGLDAVKTALFDVVAA